MFCELCRLGFGGGRRDEKGAEERRTTYGIWDLWR